MLCEGALTFEDFFKTISGDLLTFEIGPKDENTVNIAAKRAVPKLNNSQTRELQVLIRIGHFVPT